MAAGSQRDEPVVSPKRVSRTTYAGEAGADPVRASRRREGPHTTARVL